MRSLVVKNSRHYYSAFSLTELLVVTGILAALASIILPVASRIRNQALTAACAAHERQILASAISYASDNDGYLFYAPLCSTFSGTPSGEKQLPFVMDFSNQPMGLISYVDTPTGPGLPGNGILWPYLGSTVASRQAIMTCPDDTSEQGGAKNCFHTQAKTFPRQARLQHEALMPCFEKDVPERP